MYPKLNQFFMFKMTKSCTKILLLCNHVDIYDFLENKFIDSKYLCHHERKYFASYFSQSQYLC